MLCQVKAQVWISEKYGWMGSILHLGKVVGVVGGWYQTDVDVSQLCSLDICAQTAWYRSMELPN